MPSKGYISESENKIDTMNVEEFREYCLSLPDVTEATPFEKFSKGRFTIKTYLRIPPVHGVLHLYYVRHPTEFRTLERGRTGYVGRDWQGLLDDYRHDYYRWCHTLVHLCPTHMVFVLPDGNHLQLGST